MMSDISLGQIRDDLNYNFKNKFDEENEVFAENLHSCNYFELDEMKSKFKNETESNKISPFHIVRCTILYLLHS